jgi:hypothetical protein
MNQGVWGVLQPSGVGAPAADQLPGNFSRPGLWEEKMLKRNKKS